MHLTLNKYKLKFSKLKKIDIYWFILLSLPNDIFQYTSMYIFRQPNSQTYYRLTETYVSILYIPLIIVGVLYLIKNKNAKKIFLYFIILILKDMINFSYYFANDFEIMFLGTYCQFFLALFLVFSIFELYRTIQENEYFLELFFLTNILSMIISLATGIGNQIGTGDTINRYIIASLGSGESAVVLSLATVYFTTIKESTKGSFIIFFCGIVLIMLTGCRKDIFYVFFIYVIYQLKSKFEKGIVIRRKKIIFFLLFFLVLIICIIFSLLFFDVTELLSRIEINRFSEMFDRLFSGEFLDYLLADDSANGRIASIIAGFSVINQHPFVGQFFSTFYLQIKMQLFGYPTFPHSSIIWLYSVMGIFSFIIIFAYIRNFVRLVRIKSSYAYLFAYIIIRETISGGQNISLKYLIIMIFLLMFSNKIYLFSNNETILKAGDGRIE
ncbi:O-antigen ligase family protein [Thomasclavelia sp.]|uniref:O-antigen ligase family protein n=1 Tax=Thomasclavelia sp. TaxID=3025757 RepID=UPI0025F836B2|nr:O-antigen ligase family protein [Thomasclavelia sp.]